MSLENEPSEERSHAGVTTAITVLTVASLTVAALWIARRARVGSAKPEGLLSLCDKAVRALDDRLAAVVAG